VWRHGSFDFAQDTGRWEKQESKMELTPKNDMTNMVMLIYD
jgi:hypothetical protein